MIGSRLASLGVPAHCRGQRKGALPSELIVLGLTGPNSALHNVIDYGTVACGWVTLA